MWKQTNVLETTEGITYSSFILVLWYSHGLLFWKESAGSCVWRSVVASTTLIRRTRRGSPRPRLVLNTPQHGNYPSINNELHFSTMNNSRLSREPRNSLLYIIHRHLIFFPLLRLTFSVTRADHTPWSYKLDFRLHTQVDASYNVCFTVPLLRCLVGICMSISSSSGRVDGALSSSPPPQILCYNMRKEFLTHHALLMAAEMHGQCCCSHCTCELDVDVFRVHVTALLVLRDSICGMRCAKSVCHTL